MAMYYYARKLQKARRPKSPPQATAIPSSTPSNGCIPNTQNQNLTGGAGGQISSPSTSSSSNLEQQAQMPSTSRAQQFTSSGEGELKPEPRTGLTTGSIETLIRHLVPTESHYPDRAFTFAFLLASRLHVPPHEVLGQVLSIALFPSLHSLSDFPPHRTLGGGGGGLEQEQTRVANVIHLLGEWTELFPYDFRDERMMAHVRAITEKSVQVDSELIREEVSHLLTTLLARLTGLERHEFLIHRLTTENALASPLTPPSIVTICPNPTILAQQLTHLELGRLAFIGPQEFVHDFLKESTTPTTGGTTNSNMATFQALDANTNGKSFRDYPATLKKTRNIHSYLYWHTRLRFFIATEVCRMPKKKLRVRVIEHWIETARECFNIGNFNSLMAILMAFNMSPLERLKKTWDKVEKTQLYFLHHQMNPSNNYANYRFLLQSLESCILPGASEERQKILIPFMSLLVKDLCFLSQECASKLANGQINFEKFWQLAKQVTVFMGWQQVQCSFPKVQSVSSVLQMPPVLNEKNLFLLSYNCEIPINSDEREHLRTLEISPAECLSNGSASENPHSSSTSTSTK